MTEATRITDIPKHERPRERLARHGPAALSDAELLAIFFRTGAQGMNAIEMGRSLVEKYGGLSALSRCSVEELCRYNKGIGPAKATELMAVFEMARRLAQERLSDAKLDSPDLVFELMGTEMQALRKESVRVLLLNSRMHLMRVEEISLGSSTECVAHPADILRPCVVNAAYGFVLVHNHPSGDPNPSQADRSLTRRLAEAAKLLSVSFCDHVIIGQQRGQLPGYFSFRQSGLMQG